MIVPIAAIALALACEVQGGWIGDIYFGQPMSAQVAVMQVISHRQQVQGREWLYDVLADPGQFCLRRANLTDPVLESYKKMARMFLTMQYQVPDLTGCKALFFSSTDKPPVRGLKLCNRLGNMRFWGS